MKAMAEATCSRSARITGATATMAEFPQMALPHATSTASRCGSRIARPIP